MDGFCKARERRISGRERGRDKTLAMTARFEPKSAERDHASDLLAAIRRAARQEQFLEVVSAEEARARFARHVDMSPLTGETVALADALGRVLAHDVTAPLDVPPFDRANVDGFAVRSADTAGASDGAPRRLRLNGEVIVCGHAPALEVAPGTATTIATGGVVPRGADAVVMIEHTELVEDDRAPAIDLRRAAAPGQFVSYAGSDIARGELVLRRGTRISSREIGMLAACGIAEVAVVRRPKSGGALDRRRARRARRPARAGAGLRQQWRDHRGGGRGSRRRAGCLRCVSRRRGRARARDAVGARGLRPGRAVRRHLKGRRRSLPPHRVEAGPARHSRPRRRAQAGQATLPRRDRRQAAGGAAGLPDVRDLHLSCLHRPGDPRPRRPAAGGGAHASKPPCRCASPPSSAARNSCWSRLVAGEQGRSRSRPPRAPARSPASRRPTDFWRSMRSRRRSMPAAAPASR